MPYEYDEDGAIYTSPLEKKILNDEENEEKWGRKRREEAAAWTQGKNSLPDSARILNAVNHLCKQVSMLTEAVKDMNRRLDIALRENKSAKATHAEIADRAASAVFFRMTAARTYPETSAALFQQIMEQVEEELEEAERVKKEEL